MRFDVLKSVAVGVVVWVVSSVPSGARGPDCADAVLVVAHGGSAEWNASVERAFDGSSWGLPVAVGYLSDANGPSVEDAYHQLTALGAQRIVMVSLMVSSHSDHMREIRSLAGLHDQSPASASSFEATGGGRARGPSPGVKTTNPHMAPIEGPVPIVALGRGLDGHPGLAEVLLDRARELSEEPARESVVLVAYGPSADADAALWQRDLERVSRSIVARGGFRSANAYPLRDDAPASIKETALAELRRAVEAGSADGRAIVIPVLVSRGRTVDEIPDALDGLDFAWSGRPLMPDERIVSIVLERAVEACARVLGPGTPFTGHLVVTGSRVQVDREDLPTTVEVIDREELDSLQATTVGDALRYVPGVTIADNGMAGQQRVVIRGIGGRRTLLMVDGERVTSQRDMSGPPILAEIDTVERVEVLKGPGSVMYGSDALAGVVNIITRDASRSDSVFGGQVAYRYSTASDLQQPSVAVAGSADRFDYRLSWSETDSDDRETPQGTLDGTSYASEQLAAALGLRVGADSRLQLRAERFESTDVGVYTGSPDLEFILPNWNRDRVSLGFEGAGLGAESLNIKGYWQSIDKDFVNSITFPTGPMTSMNILNRFDATSEIVGLDAFGQWFISRYQLVAGIDARNEDAMGPSSSTTTMITPGGSVPLGSNEYVPVDADQTAVGAFGEMSAPWSTGEVRVGLRYDWVETENRAEGETREPGTLSDSAVTGSIGLRQSFSEAAALFVSVATGFRSPNLQERYYESSTHAGGGITYGDPDLESERSLQLEIGLRGRVGRQSSYRLAAFGNEIDDLISTVRIPNAVIPGVFDYRYVNTDEARILGFEGRFDAALAANLSWLASLTYTWGEDREEGDPIYVPPLNAITSLRWDQMASLPVWSQLDLRWMDDQDRVPYQYDAQGNRDRMAEAALMTESYVTVDLALGFSLDFGSTFGAEVILRGNNLFDEDYEEPFTSVPQAGRHFIGTLRFVF